MVVRLLPNGRYDPADQGSDHNMVRATLALTAPLSAKAGTIDPSTAPAPGAPSRPTTPPTPSASATAWAGVVDSYDPTGFVRGHAVPVTYRINQGDVEVQLDGGWTRVPYYVEGVALRFVPQLVMAMHLPGDPLGSVLPPFGWAGSTTFQLPLTRPGD